MRPLLIKIITYKKNITSLAMFKKCKNYFSRKKMIYERIDF